jgi:hypothetical protein
MPSGSATTVDETLNVACRCRTTCTTLASEVRYQGVSTEMRGVDLHAQLWPGVGGATRERGGAARETVVVGAVFPAGSSLQIILGAEEAQSALQETKHGGFVE